MEDVNDLDVLVQMESATVHATPDPKFKPTFHCDPKQYSHVRRKKSLVIFIYIYLIFSIIFIYIIHRPGAPAWSRATLLNTPSKPPAPAPSPSPIFGLHG